MELQSLNGTWEFSQIGKEEWLPGEVPGGVHTDLLRLGRIPDPFVGENELEVVWVTEADWEYRRSFTPEAALLAQERVYLVCEGLDTLAEVSLNGQPVGETRNMFRPYEWEITSLLRPGENQIAVRFRSPVRYVQERQAQFALPGVEPAIHIQGSPYLRKAPSHFGWDWGPMLPPIGIWREIRLEGRSRARLAEVHLRQQHSQSEARVSAALQAERWGQAPLQAVFRLTSPSGQAWEQAAETGSEALTLEITVPDPELWWPNGMGAQPLYRAEVELRSGEELLERREYSLGLRTLELRQEPDEWGRSFTFFVNGQPLFAKGADWIPADSFPTRVTPEHLENLLSSAAQAHMNMLRVWGGGFYEDEAFYDLCDHYGLLVWQDFMFACHIYPLDDPEFLEELEAEVRAAVTRLRHRACLALWCGNNEMEWMWRIWRRQPGLSKYRRAFERFFFHTLPAWVAEADPDRPYWPSSPSSNTPFKNPNSADQGNMHYWEVWHGRRPFSAYLTQYPRFMTEFGFQSLPPLETVRAFASPEDWDLQGRVLRHRQRSGEGNRLIFTQMNRLFRPPKDFPSLVYLSMVLQAEGIRSGVEHWRRHRERVSGTIFWQLNDCWPAISWSSLDYYGRWKALHYAARRFFAPVLLSAVAGEEQIELHLTNDRLTPFAGRVRWALQSLDGAVVEAGEAAAEAPASASVLALGLPVSYRPKDRKKLALVCELLEGEERLALSVVPLAPDKSMCLEDPQIQVELSISGDELVLEARARSLARFVELGLEGADVVFSDNYFDLPAGYTRRLTCPLPEGWGEAEARAAIRVRSLFDSYR